MLQSFEFLIGPVLGPNTSYSLNVDLCHEAVLVSIETKPNDVLANATDITLNFSIPEQALERWNKGSRSFEVRSVPELDPDDYPDYVLVGSAGEQFVFENMNYEREIEEQATELDQYYGLLDQIGEAEVFSPSARTLLIARGQAVGLHLKEDPFKTVVRIELVNHFTSGRPSLNVSFEHAALPDEGGIGVVIELDELARRIGEIVNVPDETNRPVYMLMQVDLEESSVSVELDENVVQEG